MGAVRKGLVATGVATVLAAAAPGLARADAPMPYGLWQSPGNEQLLVGQDNTCSIGANNQITAAGSCSWRPSARGGILDITYPMPLAPGHVYLNILRVDDSHLIVVGANDEQDPFERVQ